VLGSVMNLLERTLGSIEEKRIGRRELIQFLQILFIP
jgi:hypothetical protein